MKTTTTEVRRYGGVLVPLTSELMNQESLSAGLEASTYKRNEKMYRIRSRRDRSNFEVKKDEKNADKRVLYIFCLSHDWRLTGQ